jgi:hypothetical protein
VVVVVVVVVMVVIVVVLIVLHFISYLTISIATESVSIKLVVCTTHSLVTTCTFLGTIFCIGYVDMYVIYIRIKIHTPFPSHSLHIL